MATMIDHREQLETICNNATAALFIMDEKNHCTYMNPAAVALTGYTLEDVRGKPLHDFIHHSHPDGSHYPMEDCPIGRTLLSGAQALGEEIFIHRDGRFYDVSFAASLIRQDDKVIGAVLEVQDITERKRSEEALRAANVQLLENDRRKDEFLAMLAHELRNPLAPIRNTITLLESAGESDAGVRQYLDILQRQTASLSGLVDDLLDVSRITRGLVELKREPVNMATVVHCALESAQVLIDQKGHEVSVSLPDQAVLVKGDSLRLEQILVNLLTNAAKYTDPEGSIHVGLETANGEALLRVRDSGIGLEPDMLRRIFDLFGQAERGLDRSQGGLGIGLTIARNLVKLHGGRIQARSPGLGEGAEFIVTLPLASAESPEAADPGKAHRHPIPPRRVLVVDDNVDAARTLALLLESAGHETALAHDSASALALADDFAPELILLDIGLPVMNGYEVAKILRQNPRTRNVVLAALTGYGQADDVERALAAGFDQHFVKPLQFDELLLFMGNFPVSPQL